jgi:hypothetical protein
MVRVLTEAPGEIAGLLALLESRGFLVQTSDKSDLFSPSVDLEIDLRVMPLGAAIHMAQRLVPNEIEGFIGNDIFTGAVFEQEPSPTSSQIDPLPYSDSISLVEQTRKIIQKLWSSVTLIGRKGLSLMRN